MFMHNILKHEESVLAERLAAVKHMLSAYADDPADTDETLDYKMRVIQVARDTINANGGRPVRTKDMVQALKVAGVEIRGKRESNAVSALLSKRPEFRANDRNGWTLA